MMVQIVPGMDFKRPRYRSDNLCIPVIRLNGRIYGKCRECSRNNAFSDGVEGAGGIIICRRERSWDVTHWSAHY